MGVRITDLNYLYQKNSNQYFYILSYYCYNNYFIVYGSYCLHLKIKDKLIFIFFLNFNCIFINSNNKIMLILDYHFKFWNTLIFIMTNLFYEVRFIILIQYYILIINNNSTLKQVLLLKNYTLGIITFIYCINYY